MRRDARGDDSHDKEGRDGRRDRVVTRGKARFAESHDETWHSRDVTNDVTTET